MRLARFPLSVPRQPSAGSAEARWRLDHAFTPWRLQVYPIAALAGVLGGFVIFVLTSDGLRAVTGGRVGGDLPAFYGAARIVRSGMAEQLYDSGAQRAAQADLIPGAAGGWLHFAYPPFVAVAYVPLTFLDFKAAYVVHTIGMALCAVLALWLLRRDIVGLERHLIPCVAAALTFYPLFRAIVGGQNTALSLLCAAGTAAAAARGRDIIAGLCLGVWMFKPQFALIVGVALVISGRPKVLLGAAITCAAWYLSAAAIAGSLWPLWWWEQGVVPFAAADLHIDRGNGISFKELAFEFGIPTVGLAARLVTGALVFGTVLCRRSDAVAVVGTSTAAAGLLSPHALFYDGALSLLALARAASMTRPHLLVFAWVLAQAQSLRVYFWIPPIMALVLVALGVTVWLDWRHGRHNILVSKTGRSLLMGRRC